MTRTACRDYPLTMRPRTATCDRRPATSELRQASCDKRAATSELRQATSPEPKHHVKQRVRRTVRAFHEEERWSVGGGGEALRVGGSPEQAPRLRSIPLRDCLRR